MNITKYSSPGKAMNFKKKCHLIQSDDDDSPSFLSSKYAEPPTSKIYNSRFTKKTPAELFRKDLISAMKLPDAEPLVPEDFWTIEDPWKPEWEKGVQVPVEPDALHQAKFRLLRNQKVKSTDSTFELPKKLYCNSQDKAFSPETHVHSFLPELARQTCQYDLDEVDLQWLAIINEERIEYGIPPVEESTFEKIIEEIEIICHENIQEITRNEGVSSSDEDAICDVCRSPDSEESNVMVFCDSCNICVHQSCYGISRIPDGSWVCCTCALSARPQCVLCPNRGGAMKPTRSGKWCHVSCAIWMPEVSIGSVEKMEPITKISHILPYRWSLVCTVCNKKHGACIQCSVKSCKTAYHVTCAFKEKVKMRAIMSAEDDDALRLKSYCSKHVEPSTQTVVSDVNVTRKSKHIKKEMQDELRSRREKLQQAQTANFFNYVSVDEILEIGQYDKDIVELIYNYWKLKRKANFNCPLIPHILPHTNVCSLENNYAFNLVKKLVLIRRDLERMRNLSYMVTKREKMNKSWIIAKMEIFEKQMEILQSNEKFTEDEKKAILCANEGDMLHDKKYTGSNSPSQNTLFVLNTLIGEENAAMQLNSIARRNKKYEKNPKIANPYAKHYFNGLLKRSERWFATVDLNRKEESRKKRLDQQNAEISPVFKPCAVVLESETLINLTSPDRNSEIVCDLHTQPESTTKNEIDFCNKESISHDKFADELSFIEKEVPQLLAVVQPDCMQTTESNVDGNNVCNSASPSLNIYTESELLYNVPSDSNDCKIAESKSQGDNTIVKLESSNVDEITDIMANLTKLMPEEGAKLHELENSNTEAPVEINDICCDTNRFSKHTSKKVFSEAKESLQNRRSNSCLKTKNNFAKFNDNNNKFNNTSKLREIFDVLLGKNATNFENKNELQPQLHNSINCKRKSDHRPVYNHELKSFSFQQNKHHKRTQSSEDLNLGSALLQHPTTKSQGSNIIGKKKRNFCHGKSEQNIIKKSDSSTDDHTGLNDMFCKFANNNLKENFILKNHNDALSTLKAQDSDSSTVTSNSNSPEPNTSLATLTKKPIVLVENMQFGPDGLIPKESAPSKVEPQQLQEAVFPSVVQARKGSLTGYKIPKKLKTSPTEPPGLRRGSSHLSPLKDGSSVRTVVSLFPATNSYQVRPLYKGNISQDDPANKCNQSVTVMTDSQASKPRDSASDSHQWKKMASNCSTVRHRYFLPKAERPGIEFLPRNCGIGFGSWRKLAPSQQGRPMQFDYHAMNHFT